MAIINRFLIARVHEVVLDVPAGLVQDDPYSSFTLDDPTKVGNSGTSDFLGLVKKIVLLVDIRKNVINTNPKNLQVDPLPYNQYIRLTQKQFDEALANGDITMNENTRGNQDEIIGWIQAGTSRPSLYYEDCTDKNTVGKIPKVDNYFNFEDLNLDNKIVRGPGAGDPLEVIKDFNVNETTNNWGISAAFVNGKVPPSTVFKNYMYQAISRRGSTYGFTFDKKELRNIRLGIANRQDHFDGDTKTNLYGLHPITGQRELEKTVYTNPRDGSSWNISIGIQSYSQSTVSGNCLPLNLTVVQGDVNQTDLETILSEDDSNGLSTNLGFDAGVVSDEPLENNQLERQDNYDPISSTNDSFISLTNNIKPCTRYSQLPFKYYDKYNNLVQITNQNYNFGGNLFGVSNSNETGLELIDFTQKNINIYPLNVANLKLSQLAGLSDPRTIAGNDLIHPNGTLKALLNTEECVIEIHQSYRDKDGDIPEHIGPYLDKYMEDLRRDMIDTFFTGTPLVSLGHGSDGLDYYSDGNSYIELHGQSIFGCGMSFSIADIPEIFNELYRHKVGSFGDQERYDVNYYRKIFEKARYVPSSALRMNRWLEAYYTTRNSGTLRELMDDFILGIPDLDFALVSRGSDSLQHLYDIHAAQTGYQYIRQMGLTAIPPDQFKSPFIDYSNLGLPTSNRTVRINPATYVLATDSNFNITEILYSESAGGGQILGRINPGPGDVGDFWSTFKFRDSSLKAVNAVSKILAMNGNNVVSSVNNTSTEKMNERIIRQEASAYMENWDVNSKKPRADQIYFFRVFDRFWSRPMYKNIYIDVQFDEISVEDGKKMLGKDFPKDVDFEKLEIYDWPIFQNKTLKQMRIAQSKLSCPSRWKSMMRPLYAELWKEPDNILPANVATRKYFGEGLLELELGDYLTHRKLFGMEKNLYDILDDTLSIRIHEDTFLNPDGSPKLEESDIINETTNAEIKKVEYFSNLVNGINDSIYPFFNQKFANIAGFDFNRYKVDIDTLLNSSKNLSDYGSYAEVIKNTLNVYRDISELFKKMFPDVTSFDDFWEKLKKYYTDVSDFIEKFFTDGEYVNSIKEDLFKNISAGLDDLLNDFAKFADDALLKMADQTIQMVSSSVLESVKKQINRASPERTLLSPRRIFKNGSVYLRSKSGAYVTNRQPCPIIFLGFNDNVILSSFSTYNGQEKCLDGLKKTDQITNVKYVNPKYNPLMVGGVGISSAISPNIGNMTPMPDTNIDRGINIKSRIDTIPVINKRPRQYGRNPFLDIFYLNLIPESYANNPKSAKYTHRTGTPIPIRYPNTNDSNGRLFVKDYSVPSYFPPHWNEMEVAEGSGFNYREQADLLLGDELYLKRQRLNILSAKERWNMSIAPIGGGENIVILEDNTPILDIYFGLLQLHIHGLPWSELNEYINIAKSSLKIGSSRDTKFSTEVASHFNSSINLTKLNNLWEIIRARMEYQMPLFISQNGVWRGIEPISPFIKTNDLKTQGDVDQSNNHVKTLINDLIDGKNWSSTNNPTTVKVKDITVDYNSNLIISETDIPYLNQYVRRINFMNNTNSTIEINEVRLKNISNPQLDIFNNSAVNMFSFGDLETSVKFEKIEGDVGKYILKPSHTIKRSWKLAPFNPKEPFIPYVEVAFIPYGAQPSFKYIAELEFIGKINGIEYSFSQKLVGETDTPHGVTNWNTELLEVSDISFGNLNNIYDLSEPRQSVSISFKNYAREEIFIEKLEIIEEKIFDTDDKELDMGSRPIDLFSFKKSIDGPDTSGVKILDFNDSIPNPVFTLLNQNSLPDVFVGPDVFINKFGIIGNDLYKPNRKFRAKCLITYHLNPRLNSTDTFKKTKTFEIEFYS